MSNPFSGIITSEFKTLYTNAIDALLEDDACMVQCTLVYEGSKFTDCPNCIFDPVTGKSSNIYVSGGPLEFHTGICPYCGGMGRIEDKQTESIYLLPLWNYRDWIGWAGTAEGSRAADGMIQTISKMSTITSIKRAKEVIINTALTQYTNHTFTRASEPNPCGLGNDAYIFTMWKRAGKSVTSS